jgi:hypothetical protein
MWSRRKIWTPLSKQKDGKITRAGRAFPRKFDPDQTAHRYLLDAGSSTFGAPMPTDSLLIAIGVCVVFLLFAFVVAWADHTTSRWISDRAAGRQTRGDGEPTHRKVA